MKRLLAVDIGPNVPLGNGTSVSRYTDFSQIVSLILRNSLTIAGILFVALLLIGGLMFIISAGSGDSKKTQASLTAVTDALIGFAVVFLAYVIIQIVQVITGMQIL